jgi:hypothetical protein
MVHQIPDDLNLARIPALTDDQVRALALVLQETMDYVQERCAKEAEDHGYPQRHADEDYDRYHCQDDFIGTECCNPKIAASIRALTFY